jgi:hypothetical protein
MHPGVQLDIGDKMTPLRSNSCYAPDCPGVIMRRLLPVLPPRICFQDPFGKYFTFLPLDTVCPPLDTICPAIIGDMTKCRQKKRRKEGKAGRPTFRIPYSEVRTRTPRPLLSHASYPSHSLLFPTSTLTVPNPGPHPEMKPNVSQ